MFNKYQHKPLQYGLYDCNLMVLEHLNYDLNTLAPYDSVMSGATSIKALTKCQKMQEVLIKAGYQKINPMLISEGCIVIKGIHCFIFHKSHLFGVHPDTKTFEFFKVDYSKLNNFEVFKHG